MIPFVATHLPRLTRPFTPDLFSRIKTSSRVVYFTFDDGPTPTLTQPLLDLLARFEAKATFFLIGQFAKEHPDLVRELHEAGHTIGNHTFTHPDAWKNPAPVILEELEYTTALLEDQIQQPLRWMRPPYGHLTRTMRHWCRARRQRMTLWDVMPGDFLASSSEKQLEKHMLRYIRPGSIVVLHDNPKVLPHMPKALETVLSTLQDQGWQFAAL